MSGLFEPMRKPGLMLALCSLWLCFCGAAFAQTLPGGYNTSWMDNSFGGTEGPMLSGSLIWASTNDWHVQDDIQALYVAPNGECYTNSLWDEGGREAGIYQGGTIVGNCEGPHWWCNGGMAVTSDGTYVYAAVLISGTNGRNGGTNSNGQPSYPPNTTTNWYAVGRYTLSGEDAPFPTGYGPYSNLVVVTTNSTSNANNVVTGMVCTGGNLYVSDWADNVVNAYNTSTLSQTPVSSYSESNPGALTVDGYGNVWGLVYSGTTYMGLGASLLTGAFPALTGCSLVPVTSSGGNLGGSAISFAAADHPVAVSFNASSGLLMVADQGPDQNIKCYDPTSFAGSPTTVSSSFGVTGGVFAGTTTQGNTGALRFNMPSGVGSDSSGNVYVSQDGTPSQGGTVLSSYTSAGTQNWSVYGGGWFNSASLDLNAQNNYYTVSQLFTMDWNNKTPGTEATYKAYTINPFTYPEDPRLHLTLSGSTPRATFVRTLGSAKILFTTTSWDMEYFRHKSSTHGSVAIPSGMFSPPSGSGGAVYTADRTGWPENQPSSGEWIWRDANGNGTMDAGEYNQPSSGGWTGQTQAWYVDTNGNVWEGMWGVSSGVNSIREFTYQGLDSEGNPIYSYANMTSWPAPAAAGFTEIHRIEYFPSTDTLYIVGFNTAYPDPNWAWTSVGEVIYRYDNWSTTQTLHSGYPIVMPFNGTSNPEVDVSAIDIDAGQNYLFAGYQYQNQVYVYSASTGALAGIITPSSDIGGSPAVASGAANCIGGMDNFYGVHVDARTNGEYDITQEDDWLNKVVLYRWMPSSTAAPAAPTAVTAIAGNTAVGLTWTGSSGATSYNIYRGTTSSGISSTPIASGLAYQYTCYTDSSATSGNTYYYKIKAVNSSGTSGYSSVVNATSTSTNLQADPGFETDPLNAGSGWNVWSGNGCQSWSSSDYHTGSYGLEYTSTTETSGNCQSAANASVTPGGLYTFGVWVETNSLTSTAGINILEFDSAGNTIADLQPAAISGTNGWTYLSQTDYLPLNCTNVGLWLGFWNGSGTVVFDDTLLAPGP